MAWSPALGVGARALRGHRLPAGDAIQPIFSPTKSAPRDPAASPCCKVTFGACPMSSAGRGPRRAPRTDEGRHLQEGEEGSREEGAGEVVLNAIPVSYAKDDPTAPVVFHYDWAARFKAEVRNVLDTRLADVFLLLWEKYYLTGSTWTELKAIINCTPAEVKLISEKVPLFIRRATDSMWHEVISNMVSFAAGKPGKSVGDYVSLRKLAQLSGSNNISSLVKQYTVDVIPLQRIRNEHVDHWGLNALAVRDEVKVVQEDIDVLFELVYTVLDAFAEERGLPLMHLPSPASGTGGARDFLRLLKEADGPRRP